MKSQEKEINNLKMGKKKKINKTKKAKKKQKKIINKKLVGQNTFKTSDEKIAIKKIKKQTNSKRIYNIILFFNICVQLKFSASSFSFIFLL